VVAVVVDTQALDLVDLVVQVVVVQAVRDLMYPAVEVLLIPEVEVEVVQGAGAEMEVRVVQE
jgi:hypothetical protein